MKKIELQERLRRLSIEFPLPSKDHFQGHDEFAKKVSRLRSLHKRELAAWLRTNLKRLTEEQCARFAAHIAEYTAPASFWHDLEARSPFEPLAGKAIGLLEQIGKLSDDEIAYLNIALFFHGSSRENPIDSLATTLRRVCSLPKARISDGLDQMLDYELKLNWEGTMGIPPGKNYRSKYQKLRRLARSLAKL